jgi:hypothetical protein
VGGGIMNKKNRKKRKIRDTKQFYSGFHEGLKIMTNLLDFHLRMHLLHLDMTDSIDKEILLEEIKKVIEESAYIGKRAYHKNLNEIKQDKIK